MLHLVNLTNEGGGRGPVDELLPVGPVSVRVRLPPDVRGRALRLLVSGRRPALDVRDGWASFPLESVPDHEVAVIDG